MSTAPLSDMERARAATCPHLLCCNSDPGHESGHYGECRSVTRDVAALLSDIRTEERARVAPLVEELRRIARCVCARRFTTIDCGECVTCVARKALNDYENGGK